MNDKTSEAGLLYCVRAAERVQRVLLRPGQQQALKSIARLARDLKTRN
jgi:hypothetical protein